MQRFPNQHAKQKYADVATIAAAAKQNKEQQKKQQQQ
jgi:uncharacterized membrane protein